MPSLRLICTSHLQYLTCDERLIPFKGRSKLKVYVKNKPTKWGLKVYLLVDSATRFVLAMLPYGGAKVTGPERDHGAKVVTTLMEQFVHQGHTVVCDNFFTTLGLAKTLWASGTAIVGTMQRNRNGLPDEISGKRAPDPNGARGRGRGGGRGRGRSRARSSPRVVLGPPAPSLTKKYAFDVLQSTTEPYMTLSRFKDRSTKPVLLISTATSPTATATVSRLQKQPAIRVVFTDPDSKEEDAKRVIVNKPAVKYAKLSVVAPAALGVYQSKMGGVDQVDQFLSYQRLGRLRTRKMWKTLFWSVLDLSVHNAWVLYRRDVDPKISNKNFRVALAEELIGDYASGRGRSKATQRQKDEGHLPVVVGHTQRQRCKECKAYTPVRCVGCDSFFCLLEDRNCFTKHHNRLFHST